MVDVAGDDTQGQVVVYARVSSADQRADLDRQVARVTAWATILTSLCARLYGRGAAASRASRAVAAATAGDVP
jgi:predicted site-specific integrase-resolvase